ncbi:MAG: methyltransferase domain-containing protein [Lachnospiraceae bacterium]|nr:methyltransferase domain-containing protein [Lachnospiraceae bacterium]
MYINNDINYLEYLKNKTVYIFGAADKGKKCVYQLEKKDINIAGFIDNNEKLYKERINNYPVISIDAFKPLNNANIMVVICSFHEREIKQQLLNANIFNFISDTQIDFGGGEEYYDAAYFEYYKKIGEFGGRVAARTFAPYVDENMTIVDFGSGGGYVLANLKAKEKVGIEINDIAREVAQQIGIKSVKYISDLPDEYADVIISNGALEHVENPFGIIKELRNKLKENGYIVFCVPNESCETEYCRSEVNNHLYTWNCLNLGNLFKAAGYFVHLVVRTQSRWPRAYSEIAQEVSQELFDELCSLRGHAVEREEGNHCIIVAYK